MKIMKLICITLIVVLCASTAFAADVQQEYYATPGDRYAEPVTVVSARILDPNLTFPEGDDIENNAWTRQYLAEHNIVVSYKWTAPDATTYADKANLALVSGELPDFMWLNASQYQEAVEAGLLMDLTDVYETYASQALKDRMTLVDNGAITAGTYDNKLYAVVETPSWQTDGVSCMYIRKDWMEKLGKDAPTTLDELLDLAKAFIEEDPDGNGVADTIGMDAATLDSLQSLFNAQNAYRGIWLKMDDGTYEYSSIQPEMRDALLNLQAMYAEGLLPKDFLTDTTWTNFVSNANTNRAGILFYGYVGPLLLMDGWDADHSVAWGCYPIPALTEDAYPAKSQAPNGYSTYWVVSKNCEHPEALIKILNTFVDQQSNNIDMIHDPDGRPIYQYNAASISTPDNNYINMKFIAEAIETGDTSKMPVQAVQALEMVQAYIDGSTAKNDWAYYWIFSGESTQMMLDKYYIQPKNYVQNAWYAAQTPGMVSYGVTLTDLENQMFAEIITGSSIDLFDQFVSSWLSMGGEQMTQEVNSFFAK